MRALEVHAITGRPITEMQRAARRPAPVRVRAVYLERSSADLARRIERRTRAMIDGGLEDETARVLDRFPAARALLEKTVGYAQVLRATSTEREALGPAIALATRQYARRQRIWFQKMPSLVRLTVRADDTAEDVADRVHRAWRAEEALA